MIGCVAYSTTTSAQLATSRTGKAVIVIIILAIAAFAIYARATGKSLHVKTGVTKGTNYSITEYLDNQDYIEGQVTTTVPSHSGNDVVIIGNSAIDLNPVTMSANKTQPTSRFIRGDIKPGARIKAIVRKVDEQNLTTSTITPTDISDLQSRGITSFYQVMPYDPFYIAAQ